MKQALVKSYSVYRDSKTGKFVSHRVARNNPSKTRSEVIKVPLRASKKSAKVIGTINSKYSKALNRLAKR